jgi:hypothetical protein
MFIYLQVNIISMISKGELMKSRLKADQAEGLLKILKERFENNRDRHKELNWSEIKLKLESSPDKLWSLNEMERTGGEPDVIGYDKNASEFIFCDCSPETPGGRRNLCYDNEALESRKANKPGGSAVGMADSMGIEMVTKEQYYQLQETGKFDTKTSSWVKTPDEIRKLGGALFCDRRYDSVFTYHNGAESYYSGRGFRGILRV